MLHSLFPTHACKYLYDDNCTSHKSDKKKGVDMEEIRRLIGIDRLNMSARSYDLNPVEKIHALVSEVVYDHRKKVYTTAPALRQAVVGELKRLNESGKAAHLFQSFKSKFVSRLQECVDKNGDRLADKWM